MNVVNLRVPNSIFSDKKYISFLQENSVPTKENDCGDVTHDGDEASLQTNYLIVLEMKMV